MSSQYFSIGKFLVIIERNIADLLSEWLTKKGLDK
jgi:hypothetical protein